MSWFFHYELENGFGYLGLRWGILQEPILGSQHCGETVEEGADVREAAPS